MARKLRVQYPGAVYHVMSRGNHRGRIVRNDSDRQLFLKTLGEACQKANFQVHAYCLMNNHFHLVIETPKANLVAGMKWFLSTYTARHNRRHKLFGHLFSGRYKALMVDAKTPGYLRAVCEYVHLNPVRAKVLQPQQPLSEFQWSSYPAYLKTPSQRPAWLRVDRVLGELRISKDSEAGRRRFSEVLEERRAMDKPADYNPLRRGWCVGDAQFKQELLAQMEERRGKWNYGEELRESSEQKAEHLVQTALRQLKWKESDLTQRSKGDQAKVKIASQLRAQSVMTMEWIAQRLHMGTRTHLNHLLYWHRREQRQQPSGT